MRNYAIYTIMLVLTALMGRAVGSQQELSMADDPGTILPVSYLAPVDVIHPVEKGRFARPIGDPGLRRLGPCPGSWLPLRVVLVYALRSGM